MIIGVVGLINSGKGTVADLLVDKLGYQKASFADPLKDAVSSIFGWDRTLLEGDTKESREFREQPCPWWSERLGRDITPREVLQLVGTEGIRNTIDSNVWIYALERRMTSHNIVIPDTRFPNEIKFIRGMGGKIIRVKRGPEPEWYDLALAINNGLNETGERIHAHYSEWAWIGSPVDYLIYNEGSLDELEANLTYALKVLNGPSNTQS